jgi:hypothetical protein
MAQRTTRSSVTFRAPFYLQGLDETFPAGTYDIDTEEEIIEGNERSVFLRVATLLYLRNAGTVQILTVDPRELEAALAQDRRS